MWDPLAHPETTPDGHFPALPIKPTQPDDAELAAQPVPDSIDFPSSPAISSHLTPDAIERESRIVPTHKNDYEMWKDSVKVRANRTRHSIDTAPSPVQSESKSDIEDLLPSFAFATTDKPFAAFPSLLSEESSSPTEEDTTQSPLSLKPAPPRGQISAWSTPLSAGAAHPQTPPDDSVSSQMFHTPLIPVETNFATSTYAKPVFSRLASAKSAFAKPVTARNASAYPDLSAIARRSKNARREMGPKKPSMPPLQPIFDDEWVVSAPRAGPNRGKGGKVEEKQDDWEMGVILVHDERRRNEMVTAGPQVSYDGW